MTGFDGGGTVNDRECEWYNCAIFARETVDGHHYCSTHARLVNKRLLADQRAAEAYVPGLDGRMPGGTQ